MREPPRDQTSSDARVGDDAWFRPPNRREHGIAAGLFMGFGLFFAAMFYLSHGWGFRWILLGLAIYSIGYGLRHAVNANRANRR